MKEERLTTVSEYARRKKITTQAVYKRIKTGKLRIVKKYGITLISE